MNRFLRYSACALLIGLALAATLFKLRGQFNRERAVVANLGPSYHLARAGEPMIISMGPHVIGYSSWAGPAFLESPMRRYGIPWFDRVTHIHILSDSHVSEDSLKALRELPHLRQVWVEDPTIPNWAYIDCVGGVTGRITFEFFESL